MPGGGALPASAQASITLSVARRMISVDCLENRFRTIRAPCPAIASRYALAVSALAPISGICAELALDVVPRLSISSFGWVAGSRLRNDSIRLPTVAQSAKESRASSAARGVSGVPINPSFCLETAEIVCHSAQGVDDTVCALQGSEQCKRSAAYRGMQQVQPGVLSLHERHVSCCMLT